LAVSYGTDPYTVLTWDPLRVAINCAAYDQAAATLAQMGDRGGAAVPVVVMGRLG
jgi:hypothetical protein